MRYGLIIGGITLLFVSISPALAGTVTTTFEVTATVADTCSVEATNLGFGTYNPLSATDLDATSTVSVRCTLGSAYQVGLSQGLHGTGVTDRKMLRSGETELLAYGLYRDAVRTLNWGETAGVDTVDGVGTGLSVDHTVYGRVTAEHNVSAGSYADTITVTVNY